jgi:hypothetical protein
MSKKNVIAARNLKDWTKFTTGIKDKPKQNSVFFTKFLKEIEASRQKHRVAKEMDQAIHALSDYSRQNSESRNNGTMEDRFGSVFTSGLRAAV